MSLEISNRKGYNDEKGKFQPSTGSPFEKISQKGAQEDKKHIRRDGKKKLR